MVKINECVKDVAEAFKEAFTHQEVKDVAKDIKRVMKQAKKEGADLVQQLLQVEANRVKARENQLLADEIQTIKKIEAITRAFSQIFEFQREGFDKPLTKALLSMMDGSPYAGVEGTRESTDNFMNSAAKRSTSRIANALQRNNLFPIFNDVKAHIQIAEAVLKRNQGIIEDSNFGKIADIFYKEWRALDKERRKQGILVNELSTRIIGTIHNAQKLMHLTEEERAARDYNGREIPNYIERKLNSINEFRKAEKNLNKVENENYQYAFERWFDFTMPELDHQLTFIDRGIDFSDQVEVKRIMKNVFDNLTNSGKLYSKNLNMVSRFKAERFLHFKDGESVFKYNNRFGNGNLADAMLGQLQNGFANIELVKDWSVQPFQMLDNIYKLADKIPTLKDTFDKNSSYKKTEKVLSGLVHNVYTPLTGSYGAVLNAARAIATYTHLPLVVVKSLNDLPSISILCQKLGVPALEGVGLALKNFIAGASVEDMEAYGDLLHIGANTHNGSWAHMFPAEGPDARSISSGLMNNMFKFNGLLRWDYSLRLATITMIGRHFERNKDITFDKLDNKSKAILSTYGISPIHWEIFRQSGQPAFGAKKVITPDTVSFMDNADIKKIAKESGYGEINDAKAESLKDEISRKFGGYLYDRMDHVIQRPTVRDKQFLNFGHNRPTEAIQFLYHIFATFKGYVTSFTRRNLSEGIFSGGARNLKEAFLSGRAGYSALANVILQMGAASYVTLAMTNLLHGYSLPDLRKMGTLEAVFGDAVGLFRMFDPRYIDPNNLASSAGGAILGGPILSDVSSLFRVSKGVWRYANGQDPTTLEKALFGYGKEYEPFIHWGIQPLTGTNIYNTFNPDGYQKEMDRMQQLYGSTPIG
jgi:hypothetical protein